MSEAETKEMVPAIRFDGFDGEWIKSQLGKQLEISSASRVHKEEWTKEGVPFFRTSDVVAQFKGTENSKAFISSELYKKLSAKSGAVEKGDLLVTGGGSIGIAYLINSNDPLYFKDADLLWLKNRSGISGYYLYTFFVSQPFRKHVNSISHIGTISHYTIEQAKVTPINVSTPEEQTKIGEYFQQLDALIAGHRGKLEKLQQLKKSLLEKMFPKQGQYKPEIRFAGFDEEWQETSLGLQADIVRGASPRPIENPKWFDSKSNVGWLRIKDVSDQNGRIFYLEQRLSKEGEAKTRVVSESHLLLSIAASVGKPVINYVSTGVHDGFLIFRKPSFDLEFMFQWLKSFESDWQQYGQPGSQVNLNSEIVKKQVIFVPKTKEQKKIGQLFKHTDTLIDQHQTQITKLLNIKQACLAKMFV